MSHPYGMSDAEFLDCLGPAWSAMSVRDRLNYPHEPTEEPAPVVVVEVPVRPLNVRQLAAQARRAKVPF